MITARKITTRAAEINVLEGGSGPDLLFLHSAGGITAENPFLLALAQKYRVFAPQLPGYGDSGDSDNVRDMLDVTLHSFDVLEAVGAGAADRCGAFAGGDDRGGDGGVAAEGGRSAVPDFGGGVVAG